MYFNRASSLYLQATSWLNPQSPVGSASSLCSTTFDWDNTPAHKTFKWQPCFEHFKCTRLQVPMDWQGGSPESKTGRTVEIALVKVEATVPVTDERYGGAVVLNPGGPGGSGVGQVLRGGHHIQTILSAGPDADNKTAKYFDVIGFDPRGINKTRPMLTCFPDHEAATVAFIEERAEGMIGSSDTSFDHQWARRRAVAAGCSKMFAEEGIAKHMSTAPVARDIIEIFERHGEWREAEVKRILSSPSSDHISTEERSTIIARTAYKPNKEMVQYWGFSYGTILGATLSAMFPTRIKRAILDGVADSHDYMAGGWTTNLRDTDRLFAKLGEYCHEGGPKNCALYDKTGPSAISANAQRIISEMRHNPISMPATAEQGPQIVTYNDLKLHLRDIVYNPLVHFPRTAQILYEVSQGNGTTLAAWKRNDFPSVYQSFTEQCKKDGPYSPACFVGGEEKLFAESGVACSDASPSRVGQTKEEYRAYAEGIIAQSSLMGEWWSIIQLTCTAWHARPAWRYDGNFHNTTAHPILFIGNTVDPVTPLYNAFKMAAGFQGAGVLHQNSEGHCTYASPSMCTGKALRSYFQTGELPGNIGGLRGGRSDGAESWNDKGAFCEPDRIPFDGYRGDKDAEMPSIPQGETDLELWKAMVSLNRVWP